jgi:hypothetical protein
MPLAEHVDEAWVTNWKVDKSRLWSSPEMGPWGIYVGDRFAGWSGLQPDGHNEVELAIVLNVWAWNLGRELANATLARWHTFGKISAVNVYFPESRPIGLLVAKLGMERVGEGEFAGHTFVKLRLLEPAVNVKPLEEKVHNGEVEDDRGEANQSQPG